MEATTSPSRVSISGTSFFSVFKSLRNIFSLMFVIFGAIVLFEIFNYSTTEFALSDAMGNLGFLGIRLATILSLAFCGIDFVGVAYLFSREEHIGKEREEEWYLLSAWLMAGLMNALMTWWSVTETLLARTDLGNELLARQTMITYIPIFVAGAVWIIRILLIGSLTLHVKRISHTARRPIRHDEMPLPRSGTLHAQALRVSTPFPK